MPFSLTKLFPSILIVLGIATAQARWLMPRDMWPSLPGGMPYFAVGTSGVPA